MILVRTDWPDFETYLASLSKPARKNHKAVMKQYGGLRFAKIEYGEGRIRSFMQLWEQQLVKGKHPVWAFPVQHVTAMAAIGDLLVFSVFFGDEQISAHFIQKRDGYWECHPPMYDKVKYPSLAKYMWFKLIQYAIEHQLMPLDLGGMSDEWRDNLRIWRTYKHQYKWAFVPLKAREDPDSEPRYYIGMPERSLKIHI